ncbi:MAG: fimbrillin family protein [Marinilabiliaceae bacterium]|nr:fimbrillin family protein [Marinilabiliaceae bacterium]
MSRIIEISRNIGFSKISEIQSRIFGKKGYKTHLWNNKTLKVVQLVWDVLFFCGVSTLFFVLVASLNSCQDRFMDDNAEIPYDAKKHIEFTTQLGIETRGTLINDAADMTTMGVFSSATGNSDWNENDTPNKMFNQKLINNAGVWSYVGDNVYWEPDKVTDRYSFFAYAPYADSDNGITIKGTETTKGTPSLRYVTPDNVINQPDLMVAIPRYDIRPTGNAIALHMKHALTGVGFQVSGHEEKYNEKIIGISISGVIVSGDLSVDGSSIAWSNLGTPQNQDFSASLNFENGNDYFLVTENMSTNLIAENGYLMMIPQTLGENAKVTVTYQDGSTTEINLSGHKWEPGKQVIYNITLLTSGSITITPDFLLLQHGAQKPAGQKLMVITQKSNGTTDTETQWTLTVPESNNWLALSLTNNNPSKTISGKGTQSVNVFVETNGGNDFREATISMNFNGNQVAQTVVRQNNDNIPAPEFIDERSSIVGAFWRHNQIGERIVQVNVGNSNSGAWAASVTEYDGNWDPANGDGVLLAASGSLDPKIGTDNPGNAEDYPMNSYNYSNAINGYAGANENITFRIGLQKPFSKYNNENPDYTTSFPARYAVVELWYNDYNKYQKIYLRQGEGDDYVIKGRGYSVKFAPYNLTVDEMNKPVSETNKTKFTEYPSQVGAYFQWSSDVYFNWAWDNYTDKLNIIWQSTSLPDYNSNIHEVSPPNYRRPNDNGTVDTETRHSLWENYTLAQGGNGNQDNYAYGYYADGFYDRRPADKSNDYTSNGVVAGGTKYAAFGGGLFFNENTKASLFFPVGGQRDGSTGIIKNQGITGYYLTGGMDSWFNPMGICLQDHGYTAMGDIPRGQGSNIRSVRN